MSEHKPTATTRSNMNTMKNTDSDMLLFAESAIRRIFGELFPGWLAPRIVRGPMGLEVSAGITEHDTKETYAFRFDVTDRDLAGGKEETLMFVSRMLQRWRHAYDNRGRQGVP